MVLLGIEIKRKGHPKAANNIILQISFYNIDSVLQQNLQID